MKRDDAPHVIVTRFSVPRSDDCEHAGRHADSDWLDRRIELLRRFFVPSVARLAVPVVLLSSSESAAAVSLALNDLDWLNVEVQDDWRGGWTGRAGQTLTRMDSDDAIHEGWFAAVDAAPAGAEVCISHDFLRLDPERGRLCAYRRRVPCPLAAFRNGANPYLHDHADLENHYRTHRLGRAYLLQVFHGGNVSTRRPSWYRRRLSLARLGPYGVSV